MSTNIGKTTSYVGDFIIIYIPNSLIDGAAGVP